MSGVSSPPRTMTPDSDVDSSLANAPLLQGNNVRVVIRQLLEKYGREEVDRLVAEEEASSSPTD
ncbi:hypothetical protein E4U21_007866 [Claviceps maximensis]|nr:hypothetical protein E4U21_007866 [Claviceps maximensis]